MNEADFISKLKESGNFSEKKFDDHKIFIKTNFGTKIELIEVDDDLFENFYTPAMKKSLFLKRWNKSIKDENK